jgi:hypothetical protein
MFNDYYSDEFEINLVVRDSNGNPTGKRKSFSTNDPYKLWVFFNRFQGRPKRKKKKVKNIKEKISTNEE